MTELSAEEQLAVTNQLRIAEVAAGEVLLKTGEVGSKFYVVKEGKVTLEGADGASEIGEGDFFGEECLAHPGGTAETWVSDYTATCTGNGKVFYIDRPTYLELKATIAEAVAVRHKRLEREKEAPPLEALEQKRMLGTGTFGRVKLVTWTDKKGQTRANALKCLSKDQLAGMSGAAKAIRSVMQVRVLPLHYYCLFTLLLLLLLHPRLLRAIMC